MSWQAGQRIVAETTGATVHGSRIAGGAQLHIDVAFRLVEWPWKENGPISLVPQPSEVTARFAHGELSLGFALPNPTCIVSPPSHSWEGHVHFTLSLTTAALVALEASRDGGPIAFFMTLVAHPIRLAQHQGYAPGIQVTPTVEQRAFELPKEQWLAVLKNIGYCDSLLTELRLPASGPESTSVGRLRIMNAVNARNDGRYRNTVQECRIALDALDALESAGFDGRAPNEVTQFLQKNARNLSQAVPDEEFSREDADLAIAMTAALLRLALRWGAQDSERDTKESAS